MYIYALEDPETNHIRYVGKSVNPKARYNKHLARSFTTACPAALWINSLIQKGLKPTLLILEEVTEETWEDREIFWINIYKNKYDLTNVWAGGLGKVPVYKYDLKGNFLEEYPSAVDCVKSRKNSTVTRCCKKDSSNYSYNGYMWRYYKKEKIEPYTGKIR